MNNSYQLRNFSQILILPHCLCLYTNSHIFNTKKPNLFLFGIAQFYHEQNKDSRNPITKAGVATKVAALF